jgi:hypothetical protein
VNGVLTKTQCLPSLTSRFVRIGFVVVSDSLHHRHNRRPAVARRIDAALLTLEESDLVFRTQITYIRNRISSSLFCLRIFARSSLRMISKMMSVKLLSATVLITLVVPATAQADPNQYLCTVEHAAGLHYDKQTNVWKPQEFGSRKYILRRLTDDDRDENKGKWWALLKDNPKANWAFYSYGKDKPMPLASCVEDSGTVMSEMFYCRPVVNDARFDKDTRRFEIVSHGAYIDQGFWEQRRREDPNAKLANAPSKPDDLFVEIGNCSPS